MITSKPQEIQNSNYARYESDSENEDFDQKNEDYVDSDYSDELFSNI